jgi:hypothetical protein
MRPDLAQFQEAFAEALMADSPMGLMARQPGFAVYRNTCARGSVEALRSAFPTVDMLMGEDMFTEVALAYRGERPPASPVLSAYGATFADFLGRQPWIAELPYVADVARLDWLWLECFLAPDRPSPPKAPADHRQPRIGLHPAARFAWLATPAMTIWQAHRQSDSFDELTPEWREEGALFTRQGLAVHAEPIGRAMHLLLVACASGTPIDDCVAAVEAAHPGADAVRLSIQGLAAGALVIL